MLPAFFSPRAIVLDCGASQTTLGVVRRTGGELWLEQLATVMLPDRANLPDEWLKLTTAAFGALRRRVTRPGPVVLMLPAQLVLTKMIRTPRVDPAKRIKVIRFEAEQSIPFALADVAWDWVDAGEGASDDRALLAAARLDAIEPLCESAQRAGFSVDLLLPRALTTLAGFRLARSPGASPVLVLNLGSHSSTLLHVEGRRFVARSIPFGRQSPAVQPHSDPQPDGETAGATETGEASPAGDGASADALAVRCTQEITRSLLHFRGEGGIADPTVLHFAGGGSGFARVGEAIAAKMMLPVDGIGLRDSIRADEGMLVSETGTGGDSLLDLTGAAAIQLLPGHERLSLLPPALQAAALARRRRPWLVASAVVSMLALLSLGVHFDRETAVNQRAAGALERELAPLREQDARIRRNLHRLGEFRQEAADLQALIDRRTGWIRFLADIQERLSQVEDVWFDRLEVNPPVAGVPLRLTVSGRMIERDNPSGRARAGTAARVKVLLASLAASPFVASIEGEWFESGQPGILKFGFVLATDSNQPI